jgi:hypothetical protein
MVGFRCVTVNTLHKGDNKDNNNNNTTQAITAATGIVTKGFKKFGNHSRKTFNRFTTKAASYIWDITRNPGSTAV